VVIRRRRARDARARRVALDNRTVEVIRAHRTEMAARAALASTSAPSPAGSATATRPQPLNVYAYCFQQADRGAADVIGDVIAGEPDSSGASRR
jgi:hypothetical protein